MTLPRRKPLRRSGKGLQPKAPIARRKPQPVKRRSRARAVVYADLRQVIWNRAGGRCERCGTSIAAGFEAHHRKLRSQGGRDDVCNLVALCTPCHHEVHAHPEQARADGWIVRSGSDPAMVAVTLHDGRTVRLEALEDGAGYDVVFTADGRAAA